jgi:hypothetical protein
MEFNFNKAIKDIEAYLKSEVPINHLVDSFNVAKAIYINRIFNSEAGATDSNDNKVQSYSGTHKATYSSAYSAGWSKKRLSHGRQIAHVDFNYSDNLVKSFKLVQEENEVKIAVYDNENIEKIKNLERLKKATIFEFTKEEKKNLIDDFIGRLQADIKKIIESYG